MTNLLTVLPDFDLKLYTHILPSLERAQVSTADLLTLDALDIAKRAQVPSGEVKKLVEALLDTLHGQDSQTPVNCSTSTVTTGSNLVNRWTTISTLDDVLDAALGGGIGAGCLTEFVGESAAGKTQFLLTLLLSVQLSKGDRPGKSALYISTEAPLQTTRLSQILNSHPKLGALPDDRKPSLERVQSTHIHDLEAQEHILRYQVPVAIERHNVGLIVVDSIAANYRPEFGKSATQKGPESLARRNHQLSQIGALLRGLAQKHNIAIVVANQIADRFATIEPTNLAVIASQQSHHRSRPGSPQAVPIAATSTPAATLLSTDDPLALDHQQLFFSGWGDDRSATSTNHKTPSLGLIWANQLAARIALLREPASYQRLHDGGVSVSSWKRTCKVVFCSWAKESVTEYEIWEGGVRSVHEAGKQVEEQETAT